MDAFTILHHGAVDGVTGSCHELQLGPDYGILIDCGLFQGAETSGQGAGAGQLQIEFPIAHIKALVVTHVHIDHVGRIPYLLAAGFKGPILCSQPSAELLPLVLEDAVKVGVSRDPALLRSFMTALQQQLLGLPYDRWFSLLDMDGRRLRLRLQRAGHILGSAYAEFELSQAAEEPQVIVFSGDLGAVETPLLPPPAPPQRCHTLVIESTYGDRCHPDRSQRQAQLRAVIEHAVANSGVVLIPAFSIGRTQELLYELEGIIAAEPLPDATLDWRKLAIIVDSPLAARFTATYRKLKPFWDAEALQTLQQGRDPLDFDQLLTVDSHREHERLVGRLQQTHEPCVVIAASGMCAGGRIVNYLKALIDDPRTDLVFVGYQARGTPGREILEQGGREGAAVRLDGKHYPVRAAVHQLSGYSAHADRKDLLDFACGIPVPPAAIRIIHGEDEAKRSLQAALRERLPGTRVDIP